MNASASPTALPAFPLTAAPLLLPGSAGALELACSPPEADSARAGVAIICHPHPLQGGTMTNKVVTTLERSLLDLGLATVRFNFRGVGQSEGVHDSGNGESDDLVAIAAWARAQRPGATLWLAGFSFGSYVVLRAAGRLQPAQLILVAPPVGRQDFSGIAAPACPWLIVQGEADEVVDPAAVFAWAATLQPPPTLVRMPDTSHFFHRRLIELRSLVKEAVAGNLPPRAA
ncbi:MAG TPA: alpha/beta hydrolase [Dokdonella sp.]